MSATALSNTQELVERTIYERIRTELVDKGYLPDITLTTGQPAVLVYPNTTAGKLAFEVAIKAIADSNKKFAIELFNNINSKHEGSKKAPRIVISSDSFLGGELGGDSTRIFRTVGQTFSAYRQPPQTVNYYFNVRIVANNVVEERIATAILSLALPKKGYIPLYNDSNYNLFCRNLNSADISNEEVGLIEKYFAYEVPDLWDMEDELVEANIAKLTEITLHPNVQSYREGTFGYGSDDLVIS